MAAIAHHFGLRSLGNKKPPALLTNGAVAYIIEIEKVLPIKRLVPRKLAFYKKIIAEFCEDRAVIFL